MRFITLLNNETGVCVCGSFTQPDQVMNIDAVFTLGPNTHDRFWALLKKEVHLGSSVNCVFISLPLKLIQGEGQYFLAIISQIQ